VACVYEEEAIVSTHVATTMIGHQMQRLNQLWSESYHAQSDYVMRYMMMMRQGMRMMMMVVHDHVLSIGAIRT
jgi:hypothetical protein